MRSLEPAVREAPQAVGAARVGFVIEAKAAQPLLLAVSFPKKIVFHGPYPGRVIAVLKIDDRGVRMVHRGDIGKLYRQSFCSRVTADNGSGADRHGDIIVAV